MTKYISFKIFDSEDHGKDWDTIKKKQIDRHYAIVHEDYFEGVIKAELEQIYWDKLDESIRKAEVKAQD